MLKMKNINLLEVSCWMIFFFKSQEDGLGNTENKETAKKIQNQEVNVNKTESAAFIYSSLFLLPSSSLLFCRLPFFPLHPNFYK